MLGCTHWPAQLLCFTQGRSVVMWENNMFALACLRVGLASEVRCGNWMTRWNALVQMSWLPASQDWCNGKAFCEYARLDSDICHMMRNWKKCYERKMILKLNYVLTENVQTLVQKRQSQCQKHILYTRMHTHRISIQLKKHLFRCKGSHIHTWGSWRWVMRVNRQTWCRRKRGRCRL